MARTRSKPAAADSAADTPKASTSKSKYVLEAQAGSSSVMFVLPTSASPDAKIVTLPHPRHGKPSRYLVCPSTGIYEFTKISAPKTMPRSWLLETRTTEGDTAVGIAKASVMDSADLYLATRTDPLFLILPALADEKESKGGEEKKRMFLTSDDHFDKLPAEYSHLSEMLRTPSTRRLLERRMGEACDTVDAGDESMYRLNETKLLNTILSKARSMCDGGLPQSMDEKFVKKALEPPLAIRRRVMIQAQQDTEASGSSTPKTESSESQSSSTGASDAPSVSQVSTAATSIADDGGDTDADSNLIPSPEILNLQRLRVAFDFICASYIAPAFGTHLQTLLASNGHTNFAPLNEYLAKIAKLRAEAVAARSQGDFSRKRMRDEEEDEARQEKKRKQEEEKKKKASESRGVRDLKKVNVTGMKKLSAFFQKK